MMQFFLIQWMRPYGKVLCLPMQQIHGLWFAGKPMYKSPKKDGGSFTRGPDESHKIEQQRNAYIQTGFISYGVEFFDVDDSRPMDVIFKSQEHTSLNPNPSAKAWKTFAVDKAYEQGLKANKKAKTDLGMVLLAAIAAGAIGFMAATLYHPASCPPGFLCTVLPNSVPSNGAITSTISSTISTAHQILQNITSSSSH